MIGYHASPEQRVKLREILTGYYDALEAGQSPDLDELCSGDPVLRPVVERLVIGAEIAEQEASTMPRLPEIPGYEIERHLASGGMAQVFVATQRALNRRVALKVMVADALLDPRRRLRFRREAEITAALDHPNIVSVYETGFAEGVLYIAMRLVDGPSLDRLDRRLSAREVAEIGRQVASGLRAAHDVGVVHRDIKPANIILGGNVAQIVDFGLARRSGQRSLTEEGQSPGTLAYMPPEIMRGTTNDADPRRDLYSLGATMYQLLADHPPFEAEDSRALVKQVLLHEPRRLKLAAGDRDLGVLIQRALEKSPEHRFQTAAEFHDELTRFLDDRPIRSRPAGIVRRIRKVARRNPVATKLLAIAVLVASVLGVVLWQRIQAERTDRAHRRALVHSALDSRDYADAWRLVATVGRDSDHDRALHRRVRDELDLEALLDRLVIDPISQDVAYLAPMVERVERGSLASSPRGQLARCFFDLFRGAHDRVREGLASSVLESYPTCRRIVAKIVGASTAGGRQTSSCSDGDDFVFAAIAMMIAECDLDAAGRSIDAALGLAPEHARAHFVRAVIDRRAGRLDSAARGLDGLLRSRIHGPEVHEFVAEIAAYRGDRRRSQWHVAKANDLVLARQLEPSNYGALILGYADLLHDDGASCGHAVDRGVRDRPDSLQWVLLRAHLAVRSGQLEAARADFAQVIERSTLPWLVRRAEVALLQLEFGTAGRRELHLRSERIVADARRAHDDRSLADALFVQYRLVPRVQTKRRMAILREILDVEPRHALANHALVQEAYLAATAANRLADQRGFLQLGDLSRDARNRARRLIEDPPARDVRLNAAQQEEVAVYAAYLALRSGHRDDAQWSVGIGRSLQSDRSAPDADPNVRILRVVAEEFGLD